MNELMVFDLQRFALHDGPGIRTTVFLKGCPLDCAWCHNPESKKGSPQLGFLEKKCIGCGRCVTACVHAVHAIDDGNAHSIDYSNCKQCGMCVGSCANQALRLFGTLMTGEEILEIVWKDRDFYQRSGGGLTVSGGEPMLQFEALLGLLKKAKGKGLHVCLDTSGQAPTQRYKEILEYVDIFLFDYKLTDSQKHEQYTGSHNRLILENLKYLCEQNQAVHLRCPMIPGINDDDEHFKAIAKLSNQYESIEQVNLMMYHDMAKGKVCQIGEDYLLSELKTMDETKKLEVSEKVKAHGCHKLIF